MYAYTCVYVLNIRIKETNNETLFQPDDGQQHKSTITL